MSSLSSSHLIVHADDIAGVELKILDGQFQVVAEGLGHLDLPLPPGFYKVEASAGFQSWSQLVALESGASVYIAVPQFDLPVSAPLVGSQFKHEYHQFAAGYQSLEVHAELGRGSAIFIMVRRFSQGQPTPPGPPDHPMTGLTLHDRDGKLIVDLVEKAAHQEIDPGTPGFEPWAACNVILDPGYYRLRQELYPGKTIEMPLVACEGWQLQLFALLVPIGAATPVLRADLAGASLYYNQFNQAQPRSSRGLDTGDFETQEGDRLTEIARQALINRKPVASDQIGQLFIHKFQNPMLGILGGYLMLLAKEPKLNTLAIVIGNLRRMLGDHPDVNALALAISGPQSPYVFDSPPMLRESWQAILRTSVTQPWIVPLGSFSTEIAPRLWGESIWMFWNVPTSGIPADSTALIRSLEKGKKSFDLSHQEAALVQQLAGSQARGPVSFSQVQSALSGGTSSLDGVDEATVQRLVYTLGVPRSSVEDIIAKLSEKAQLYESTRSRMRSGIQRTLELEKIVADTRAFAAGKQEEVEQALPRLIAENSSGSRITALGLLQARPDPRYLPFLLSAIQHSKSAFEQYHALFAAYTLVPMLDAEQKQALKAAIEAQRGRGLFRHINPGTDRWVLSENILKKL